MKSFFKRLGVTAGLLLLSVSAHAVMTVYTYAQMEMGNQKLSGSFLSGPSNETYSTDNSFSRIGIIAQEKVAHGFTAIGKFEIRFDISQGSLVTTDQTEKRGESFIGLKTKWGTFQFGAVKSPFKYWGGTSYDPFADTALEARNHGGMSGHTWSVDPASFGPYAVEPPTLPGNTSFGHDGFMQNSVSWKSLKFFGFEIWGSYSLDEADESLTTIPSTDDGAPDIVIDTVVAKGDFTFGIKYTRDQFEIGFGAFRNKSRADTGAPDAPTSDGRKFFTRFTRKKHTYSLQWERIETVRQGVDTYESNIYFLGYQYKWNEFSVLAVQYGHSEVNTGQSLNDQEVDYYAIGFIYGLSKRAQIIGGYSNSEITEVGTASPRSAERKVFSIALRLIN